MSLIDKASIIWPSGAPSKAGFVAAWNPQTQALVNFPVTRATQKWRINESGAWEVVAANVLPRDFTNGGCGDFATEPARKNLFLNSTTGATQSITVVSGRNYAVSFSGTGSITFSGGATGTLNGTGATALDRVSTIITTTTTSVTCTISGTVEYVNFEINTDNSSVAYATSWIETSVSIVTRNADVPALTGASALLGDSSGGMFIEAARFDATQRSFISLNDNSNNNRVFFDFGTVGQLVYQVSVGGVLQCSISTAAGASVSNTFFKAALRYNTNNFDFYFNGVSQGSDISGSTFSDGVLTNVNLSLAGSSLPFYGRIRQLVIFNQAPTDTQLELISTP